MRRLHPETAANYRAYSIFRPSYLMAHTFCEMFPECFHKATEIHHLKGHGHRGSLLCVEEFIRASCLGCHRWVEDNKKEARKLGLILYK